MRFCMAVLENPAYTRLASGAISASQVFAPATSNLPWGVMRMSAQDLPATAKALSLVIAVALVATALAPLIFTAARVVA